MALFDAARLKLKRASEHLARLGGLWDAYARERPFAYEYDYDESTEEHVIKIADVRPVPEEAVLLTGEAVQAMRTALDYSIADLIERATGSQPPAASKFEFPIFLDEDDYNKQKRRKLEGVAGEDIEIIDAVQPFVVEHPTKHSLWHLHRLNIEDKHRRLHVVAGALWPIQIRHVGAAGAAAFNFDTKWIDEPLRFPIEKGTEIFRYRASAELGGKVNLTFQPILLFAAPDDVRKWQVLTMLNSILTNVGKVVEALAVPSTDRESG